jgi:hypothetical protein
MRSTFTVLPLIIVPALSSAALNLYATQIPFAVEGTLCIVVVCLIALAYRYTAPFYVRGRESQPATTMLYSGIIASVIVFCVAQGIRLLGGIFYACTFIADSNAFAYQIQYVLPNFFGGIISSFTTMVSISFALGCCVVLPLVLYCNRRTVR